MYNTSITAQVKPFFDASLRTVFSFLLKMKTRQSLLLTLFDTAYLLRPTQPKLLLVVKTSIHHNHISNLTPPAQLQTANNDDDLEIDDGTHIRREILAAGESSVDPIDGRATYNWRITTVQKSALPQNVILSNPTPST
jgi:hypothetical protein